ncbi:MAG: undecaprenyldiphospho-muramoylpentapeptide beta-N-acetylglucosaminyltransferase [Acidobacteriia bacterium]|nr:undecaprenyldiphospho-muramoylpentapeptide beta-N-acetylglucosaminyltransferase [Terriglobia bacterium]
MRAVLAGGGTGGHVIPALAVAQELRACFDTQILFVGTSRGIENRLVPAAGFALKLIDVGQLKNVSIATRLKTLLALPRAVLVAGGILRDFRPDVVIGVGGYASGPAMLAAALSSVPTLAFEPNLVPGFANRVVAPMISAAAVQFRETCRSFRRCVVTGVPVRHAFFEIPERPPGAPPTLLLFGGSQGAHPLNRALIEALPELMQRVPGLHVVHQTGERDYGEAQADYLRAGIPAEVCPFIDDMPAAFVGADLLICRSGASTVAEITAAGKPALFIPFPRAADDHQTKNAEALSGKGAAMLIPESALTPQRLADAAAQLLNDPTRLRAMGAAAHKLAHRDAAGEIARLAAKLAGVPEGSS